MRRLLCITAILLLSCFTLPAARGDEEKKLTGDEIKTDKGTLLIHPINHATFVMQFDGKTIYADPVGGAKAFVGLPKPDLILVTHIHGDHFSPPTLDAIAPADAKPFIVAPMSVTDKMSTALLRKFHPITIGTTATTDKPGIHIEAVPAYNTTPGKERFHPKGRDNGYVLTLGGKRVYIAGDTEDTPEMRALKDIDIAFLPMNQPYTMTVAQAAGAIRAFRPKIVYPYHYRSGDGTKADLAELKKLVGDDVGIEIRVRDWYAEKK